MTEAEFVGKADTGDLLLFQINNKKTKFLNGFFKSQIYDHIAVILRFGSDPEEVYVAESTSMTGVNIFKWSAIRSYIGPSKFYKQCTYRHLEFERKNEQLSEVQQHLS